ncbi:MAG: TIGR02221 family CRISPR-associated protein, partial [Lachnospiraceae bacterium]|nr:TIGR02221 family CRISPR-associated protein [Lachnospiraceae bacterium]
YMKKILILTLGVGDILGPGNKLQESTEEERKLAIERMIRQNEYPYRKTDYVVEIAGAEDGKIVQSEYVAEIQIKEYEPDMVIILGTVKSGWAMFYSKFTEESELEQKVIDVLQLYQIEQSYGMDTDNETLKELEQTIQQIYSKKLILSKEKPIDIKVCLTRYGINNEQLLENYKNISDIEAYLDKNEEYDVAFDITHSFRSLPIYNLIILNYLKQVSSYHMRISHIFYGNYEVTRENHGRAPVVDLADMSEILDLTNAVSEFKNTGNAASLIQLLPPEEEHLIHALEKFDWATQINGRDEVLYAIRELADVLDEESVTRNKYVDVKNMLKTVLGEGEENLLQIAHCQDIGEAQCLLAQWYQRQNRYGLAVATAMEALRSLLVPCMERSDSENEDFEDENRRKQAVQQLDIIAKNKDRWLYTDITEFLIELEQLRKKASPIRNVFAHNLKKEDQVEMEEAKQIINALIGKLKTLQVYIRDSKVEFQKVYCYKMEKVKTIKKSGANVRIFISDHYDVVEQEVYHKLRQSSGTKKKYTVYRIPERLIRSQSNEKDRLIAVGCALCEYLSRNCEAEQVQIVLDGNMKEKKRMNFSMMLYKNGFHKLFCMTDSKLEIMPHPVFDISYEPLEIYNDEIMNEELQEIE